MSYLDHFYRQRLRSLQAIDEMVEQIVTQLEEAKILDDTYIIYTSDNGYHIGQHRLPPGKECGYEEDIRVPLYVRGPGVSVGHVEEAITTHIDLAPTFLSMAGIKPKDDFDGTSIPYHVHENRESNSRPRSEHVGVEYWGVAYAEGEAGGFGLCTALGLLFCRTLLTNRSDGKGQLLIRNNTYKALRVIGEGYNLYYSVWCNNEHELYDVQVKTLNWLPQSPPGLVNCKLTLLKGGSRAIAQPLPSRELVASRHRKSLAWHRHRSGDPSSRRTDDGPEVMQGKRVRRAVEDSSPRGGCGKSEGRHGGSV